MLLKTRKTRSFEGLGSVNWITTFHRLLRSTLRRGNLRTRNQGRQRVISHSSLWDHLTSGWEPRTSNTLTLLLSIPTTSSCLLVQVTVRSISGIWTSIRSVRKTAVLLKSTAGLAHSRFIRSQSISLSFRWTASTSLWVRTMAQQRSGTWVNSSISSTSWLRTTIR